MPTESTEQTGHLTGELDTCVNNIESKELKPIAQVFAREDFDLRKSLGTLAASRFDFKNCRGIKMAYKAVFQNDSDLELFSSTELNKLEAIRHVIVHRAGYVDLEFLKRTKIPMSIGTRLDFSENEIVEYINTGITNGCLILSGLENIILKLVHKKRE